MGITGKYIFWTGFILTIGIVMAYIIIMIIDVTCFTSWITSLSLCGIVLLGSILMLIGRAIERRSDDEI
ncbi:MAG: hypothetical protein JFT11_09225 [Muribaculaceae bacterium]|jgi:hypothetical protein|nr:hypothetical protein [Muribaculaceae bacterium]